MDKKSHSASLPAGIIKSDLVCPKWNSKTVMAREDKNDKYSPRIEFEMWYTERFGWCIATLFISKVSYRSSTATKDRTYAVTMKGEPVPGATVVLASCTVYVKESRRLKLQKFIDLRMCGEIKANDTRDRISTRRAQSRGARYSGGLFGF